VLNDVKRFHTLLALVKDARQLQTSSDSTVRVLFEFDEPAVRR
jgi:hypothetical protein